MSQGINISREGLESLITEINVLDEQLGNTAAAGKTKIRNELTKQSEELVQPLVVKLGEQFSKLEGEQLHGAYFALTKALEGVFGKSAEAFVAAEAEKNKSDAPVLTDEQRQELFDRRKDLYQQAKITADVLRAYKTDISDVEMPSPTKGSIGPKVRESSKFQFQIDGAPLPDDKQTVTAVAEVLGYSDAKTFKVYLKEKGISLGKSDLEKINRFEVEMPDGRKLSAVRQGEQVPEVADPNAA